MAGQGHFYGVRPLMGMNIPFETGVLRLSFLHYTTKDETDQLIDALSFALD
jgi:selenocysteine lyase/cysteine desulfurase